MRERRGNKVHYMNKIKDEMLSDAIATAFDFSKKVIILKRIVICQFLIIACLIAGYFLR